MCKLAKHKSIYFSFSNKKFVFVFIIFIMIRRARPFLLFIGLNTFTLCHSLMIVLLGFFCSNKNQMSVLLSKILIPWLKINVFNVKRFRSDKFRDYFNQILILYFPKKWDSILAIVCQCITIK